MTFKKKTKNKKPPLGLPRWLSAKKKSTCNAGDTGDVGSVLGSGRSSAGGNGNPLHGLPEESHGQRNLAGCSPWGRRESDMLEVT